MPKRIILGLVSAEAFNGCITKNPFHFKHYDITSVTISSDHHKAIRPIKTDFSKGFFLDAYLSLFESIGINFSDAGFWISREEYAAGFTLMGFDLTEDLSASADHWALPRQGALRIDLQFAKALTESVVAVIYSEFDNLIEIDKLRNVSLDYSS